jgi:hypothetical protein
MLYVIFHEEFGEIPPVDRAASSTSWTTALSSMANPPYKANITQRVKKYNHGRHGPTK